MGYDLWGLFRLGQVLDIFWKENQKKVLSGHFGKFLVIWENWWVQWENFPIHRKLWWGATPRVQVRQSQKVPPDTAVCPFGVKTFSYSGGFSWKFNPFELGSHPYVDLGSQVLPPRDFETPTCKWAVVGWVRCGAWAQPSEHNLPQEMLNANPQSRNATHAFSLQRLLSLDFLRRPQMCSRLSPSAWWASEIKWLSI